MYPELHAAADIERLQAQLPAPVLEVDLIDLLHELERTPDDPELQALFDTYFYYAEM